MVGLLINTVPVRATSGVATTVTDLLGQLQRDHNDTVDHEHMALNEIHRLTGHDRLFDTLFVYENYPIDANALLSVQDLAVTDFASREYNHYPLSMVATPGHEVVLRVEFDTEIFDAASIEALVDRLRRVLDAMATDPGRRLSTIDLLDPQEHDRLDEWGNRAVLTRPAPALDRSRHPSRKVSGACPMPWRSAAATGPGRTANSTRPPTGWRICWPDVARNPVSAWRCYCRAPGKPS